MRTWFPIVLLLLTATLSAQSGRTFRRESRLPVTPAASRVVEASARISTPVPQQRLRSGRAWSVHHFARRPAAAAAALASAPIDASTRPMMRRTPMWGHFVRVAATGR